MYKKVMTVIVGKTQIHLGWEALVGIIFFTITTTWALSAYTNERDKRSDQQDVKLDKILAVQRILLINDSIQKVKDDTIYSWHSQRVPQFAQVEKDIDFLMKRLSVTKTSMGYYSERKDKKGHIILENATNN